jgi:hypothetical protein
MIMSRPFPIIPRTLPSSLSKQDDDPDADAEVEAFDDPDVVDLSSSAGSECTEIFSAPTSPFSLCWRM